MEKVVESDLLSFITEN